MPRTRKGSGKRTRKKPAGESSRVTVPSVRSHRKRPAKPQAKKNRKKDGSAIVELSPTVAGIVYDGDPLDGWDDEELFRGRRRSKNGKFTGRSPKVVPLQLHHELTRRRMQRGYALMAKSIVDGANMLTSIINDPDVSPRVKLHAIEILFDRVLGKPREFVSLDVTSLDKGAVQPRARSRRIHR